MMVSAILQIVLIFFLLFCLVKPLGWYMAMVYEGKPCGLNTILGPVEKCIYKLSHIKPSEEMNWKTYLRAMLLFNLIGMLFLYAIARLQFYLPLNPQQFPAVSSDLAFNIAAGFITNTDWQSYAGENTLSYFTQMSGLTVQNFLSAATGMSLLMAFIRGLTRYETTHLGNFWVDTVRGVLYILLPLSLMLAVTLTSFGVIQNTKPYEVATLVQPFETKTADRKIITQQILPMGPVASQVAIKQLGSNGGGFFNTNSAHPFENPNPFTNFLELVAIMLIPMSLCYAFGLLVNDKRQGWTLFIAMLIILIPFIFGVILFEKQVNHTLLSLGSDIAMNGNMEGKETRFGVTNSAIWAAMTTATSNGSTNAMLDSFTPAGGLIPLWLMHLGEVIFGGSGSGLYGMLMVVIITVFVAGLMVGRTPEYLGKKIEPYEMKMASFAVLVMPIIVLVMTAIAVMIPEASHAVYNPGAHGLVEILYAFTSMINNNGSAFAGLSANTPFYNILGGVGMLIGRFWFAIPTVAIAGSLVKKKIIPKNAGTLLTHTSIFIILLISVTVVLGALTFFPALALGPLAEAFNWNNHG